MESNAPVVYLISCVSQKRKQPCSARDMYVSNWFLKASGYAEASGCRWFILSAEYGLVDPDREIAPYEQTLNTMPVAERRAWAEVVSKQLAVAVPKLSRAVVLAGERYREFLVQYLIDRGATVSVPMLGLRIGEQLSWLRHHPQPRSEERCGPAKA